MSDISARVDRLEAMEAIRQLAYGYAMCVDARDLDALVALYVEDIQVADGKRGRGELRTVFDAALRQFTTSAHHVTNHVVEFLDRDNALGLVSCRIEHEVAGQWVTATLLYHDRYVRHGDAWLFRGRVQSRLYATAADDPPVGPQKLRWPGSPPKATGFHDALPSWSEFWDGDLSSGPAPVDIARLVSRLRRTTKLPPPPIYRLSP